MGCEIVKVYKAHGISREGRDRRLVLAALIRDAAQRLAGVVVPSRPKKGITWLAPGGL